MAYSALEVPVIASGFWSAFKSKDALETAKCHTAILVFLISVPFFWECVAKG